jgi:hypothetical protein
VLSASDIERDRLIPQEFVSVAINMLSFDPQKSVTSISRDLYVWVKLAIPYFLDLSEDTHLLRESIAFNTKLILLNAFCALYPQLSTCWSW